MKRWILPVIYFNPDFQLAATVARLWPMQVTNAHKNRQKRVPRPLDRPRLQELALAYVARFSTSSAKLEAYLRRKLRERGWDDEGEPDPGGIAARFVELGYIDDESYARSRTGSLMRRGYGLRRVSQDLRAAGIDEATREDIAPGEAEQRRAAFALARKRRFGPFGRELPDRERREKQLAAMLRAGHSLDSARQMVEATSEKDAEAWVAEAENEES